MLVEDDSNVAIEHVPLASLLQVIVDQQAVISSQQEQLANKDKEITSLHALIVSQQQTNQIQEEANRCLWEELKSRKPPTQEKEISVREETVAAADPSDGQIAGIKEKNQFC